MGCHLPYGITQCYLIPDTSEWALSNPSQTGRYWINLSWRDGRLSWPSWLGSAMSGYFCCMIVKLGQCQKWWRPGCWRWYLVYYRGYLACECELGSMMPFERTFLLVFLKVGPLFSCINLVFPLMGCSEARENRTSINPQFLPHWWWCYIFE